MPRKSTRNAQGGGTIRQRSDGRWEARVTLGRDPGTGKQRQRSIYADTQKEVLKKMREVLASIDSGTYQEPARTTVAEWLNTWHAEYLADVKPSTAISYGQHIRNHIIPALGAVKLQALTAAAVQRFYNDLSREKGLSPKTVKNIHGVLHQALDRAARNGLIRSNPAACAVLPRIEKMEIRPLDAPDIKALLAALDDGVYSTAIRTALFTGMREGEILGLAWENVDFERGVITVKQQLSRPRRKGDPYRVTTPKNGKSREIKVAPSVAGMLRRHRVKQIEQRLALGNVWEPGEFPDFVFTTETGGHLCYNVLLRHFRKALDAAGLPDHRFHDLRHSFAVASLRAGDDVKTVQENLGHATAAFTLDVYAHVTDSMKEASAQRMEAFIDSLK